MIKLKNVNETDVFAYLNKNGKLEANVKSNIQKNMVDCKNLLADDLKVVKKVFNSTLTLKALEAVDNGSLILYYTKGTDRLPVYYPFIKYAQSGQLKMAVDLSNYVTVKKDKVTNEIIGTIDRKKLYCMMVSGYLYLAKFSIKNSTIPSPMLKICADLWAKIFCRVLVLKVGLGTNKERYEAFMYLATKFFVLNIMEYPEAVAEQLAVMQFRGKQLNPTARMINEAFTERGIDPYESLTRFCETIFDNSITGIRGMRINGSNDSLTFDYYLRQYIDMYTISSALTLVSFPHFLWMLISVNNFAFIFNDRTLEEMCTSEWPKLEQQILAMV